MLMLCSCIVVLIYVALCYRNAKAFDKAIQTFELAADSYYKNHAYPTKLYRIKI